MRIERHTTSFRTATATTTPHVLKHWFYSSHIDIIDAPLFRVRKGGSYEWQRGELRVVTGRAMSE